MGQKQSKVWPTFVQPIFIIKESDKPEFELNSESELEPVSDAASALAALMSVSTTQDPSKATSRLLKSHFHLRTHS